jgi:hypothetical protein
MKMKKVMKTIRLIFGISVISLITLTSCTKDFDDINTNPHGFTTASDGSLFNTVIQSLIPTGDEQFYINNEILYKQTQLAALTKEAWGNYTIGTESIWTNYYGTLPEIRELERRLKSYEESPGVINMKAMLKITLALKTFKVTDLFGDIPFSKAGYGFQDLSLLRPAYDSQRKIYLQLLEDLQWAEENISLTVPLTGAYGTFIGFDKLFNGNMLKWRKLANSLRLRHAMRMSEKEPELAGNIIKEIVDNNLPIILGYDFINPLLESACLWPSAMGFKNESLNWSFREHNNLRMGSTVWRQLSRHDSIDGSGIFDPRAYIFFETNNANKWKPYPQLPDINTPSSGGIPYGSHRDQLGAFQIKGETCIYSPFNYFVVRDEDFMPIILITGAETHFLLAEAYFRGIGVGIDKVQAEIEYLNGINSSVEWWTQVARNSKLPSSSMTFPETIPIPGNITPVSVQMQFGFWNATSEEQKLQFIYTQWWLDAFRQPSEAYALVRRTALTPRDGAALAHFRLPYPPSEAAYNNESMSAAISQQGGDSPNVKIWWMP